MSSSDPVVIKIKYNDTDVVQVRDSKVQPTHFNLSAVELECKAHTGARLGRALQMTTAGGRGLIDTRNSDQCLAWQKAASGS